MAKKVHATRTYAPLQFEALEPHRFEDLVRDLLYGYRDWQRIEATGRGGGDDGFDVRAYERAPAPDRMERENDEDPDEPVFAEGNRWMIQCKREKKLSAANITSIIADAVDKSDPPYGYVLAAPVNFTKKSYDAFRIALVERGVSEFQLLGRAELEDILYQPKNDRILFAFFGISLATRKRSKVTEIRSVVTIKNRLIKALDSGGRFEHFATDVLVRDTNADGYPDESSYPDFKERPPWRQYEAFSHHPEGLCLHVGQNYAYVNQQTKEWDYAEPNKLRRHEDRDDLSEEERQKRQDRWERLHDFWERLPIWQRADMVVDGLVAYRDIDLIDKEGDIKFKMPHLYVDFGARNNPFVGYWQAVSIYRKNHTIDVSAYERVSFFPDELPERKRGKLHSDKVMPLPSYLSHRLLDGDQHHFYDATDEYRSLKLGDVIEAQNHRSNDKEKLYVELTHRWTGTIADLKALMQGAEFEARQHLGRDLAEDEKISLLQLRRVYSFQLQERTQQ